MMTRTMTVSALDREYRKKHDCPFTLKLKFGVCRIDVHTNLANLNDNLKTYYRSFISEQGSADIDVTAIYCDSQDLDLTYQIKPPDPGKTKIKEEYIDLEDGRIVRKRLTGMVFLFGGQTNLALGPCDLNVNQVVNFINNRYIQYLLHNGCLLCHAAAVTDGNHGMAVAGFSGMGKSTLALHLMSYKLNFVSNDRLLIRREDDSLMMYGVAKHPRINPGTILNNRTLYPVISDSEREELEAIPTRELWELEQKHDVIIEEVFGQDRFDLDSALNTFVILNWNLGAGPADVHQVDLNQRRDLLPALMKSPGLFYEPDNSDGDFDFSETAYLDLLRDCRVIEISGGVDFERATMRCMEILKFD
jgi:HprK-related kinase B